MCVCVGVWVGGGGGGLYPIQGEGLFKISVGGGQ